MGATATETFASADKSYYNLFDKKGRQLILSNFVRIRKQFGLSWFFIMLFFYIMEIPIFFVGLVLSKLFMGNRSRYSFSQCRNYSKNIIRLIALSSTIIRNKPYFYKEL